QREENLLDRGGRVLSVFQGFANEVVDRQVVLVGELHRVLADLERFVAVENEFGDSPRRVRLVGDDRPHDPRGFLVAQIGGRLPGPDLVEIHGERAGVDRQQTIEQGGGGGHTDWALVESGYSKFSAAFCAQRLSVSHQTPRIRTGSVTSATYTPSSDTS